MEISYKKTLKLNNELKHENFETGTFPFPFLSYPSHTGHPCSNVNVSFFKTTG